MLANDDLIFKSKSLEILKSNNEIHAKDGVEVTNNDGLEIFENQEYTIKKKKF